MAFNGRLNGELRLELGVTTIAGTQQEHSKANGDDDQHRDNGQGQLRGEESPPPPGVSHRLMVTGADRIRVISVTGRQVSGHARKGAASTSDNSEYLKYYSGMTSDIPVQADLQPTESTSDITEPVPAKPRRGRAPAPLPPILEGVWADYASRLAAAPLDNDTRRAYASRVRTFLAWTETAGLDEDPTATPAARDGAVRDYRSHMQTVLGRKPTTVNAHLAAIGDFFARFGLGTPAAERLDLDQVGPRALDAKEQTKWLRACERCLNPRDRALGYLAFYAGPRIGESVALDLSDIQLSARKGLIIVRVGKGGRYREIPAHPVLRENLDLWINEERPQWPGADGPALFLNRRGGRLSVKGADDALNAIADAAGIDDFTSHRTRHTFGYNLVRSGKDLVLVASLMGHARIETTRRYALPTAADRQAAIDALPVDR